MKYDIILNNDEIETIINLQANNIGEAIEKLQQMFKEFDLQKSKKSQFIFNDVLGVGGNIENNPKDLICPNCKGKYVARTYSGELYYRLIMRNQSSKRS